MSYFILTASWIFYFVLHSVFAAESVKKRIAFKFYRLCYTLFSAIGLMGLLTLNGSISGSFFFQNDGVVRYLSLMFTTFGVMTIQLSFRHYNLKSFVGLADEKNELKIDGVLKYIRHPIYAGIMLVTIGFFLFIPNLPTLISCLCIFIYLPIGIYFEERKLVETFGQDYLNYKEAVPAIIPRFPIRT
ncbi:MAG: isoprenylcysteine carboxylmethyltransferase family protein [Bacteroidota bacterium]